MTCQPHCTYDDTHYSETDARVMVQERMSRGNYDTAYETYLKSQSPDLYKNEEAMTRYVDYDVDDFKTFDEDDSESGE